MTDHLSRRILEHMADVRYRPGQLHELAASLGIGKEEEPDFQRAVTQLIEDGQVVLSPTDAVALPPPGRQMTGTFRLHPRGFGFIVPDSATQHGDLFVPQGSTGGALTGDRVRADVRHQKGRAGEGRSPYIGYITEILQRAERRYAGNLVKRGTQWLVEVDGQTLHQPVIIRDPHAKNAVEGNKVVIELIEYPEDDQLGEGVIVEVLGEKGEPDVETRAVMYAFGLHEEFDRAVVAEARNATSMLEEKDIPDEREDLTGQLILTIDPPDARDFDDAIHVIKFDPPVDGASYELGVHIADVAHFVRPGSELDKEAFKRGNSTYLPRKVIPMLPEVLSNGVCSLQEGVNRYCKSAIMRYDAEGNVIGRRFARTVIRSAKRLTYLEAQALIDGDLRGAVKHARTEPKYPRPVLDMLKLMNELAHTIRGRRLKQGMIVLGLPEVQLVFDDAGYLTDAVPEDTSFTHTLIEMFMVEANEAIAALFDSINVPLLRRIHPDPPSHDIDDLRRFARVAGYNIPARPSRKELQQLLDTVRGKPAQQAVHMAVLRTLSKAEYAPLLIGHFALASDHYAHFTSPIRRYPDLVVHRALDAFLDAAGEIKGRSLNRKEEKKVVHALRDDPRCPDEAKLHEIGKHCSATERNAEAAERQLRTFFVLELLTRHLGEDFEGTVTGVTGQGVFIQLDRFLVDGFIRVTELTGPRTGGNERWALNRTTGALVAQRSGKTISIGHRFIVRIARVDPAKRQLDLAIVSGVGGAAADKPATPRKQPKGAKKSHQKSMKLKQLKHKGQPKDRKRKRRR